MAVLAGALCQPDGASAQTRTITIDAHGRWTLARSGIHQLDVPLHHGHGAVSVRYRLPAGAKQGPHTWYLINLHYNLTFADRSDSGLAYVSGLTDGRAAAQIKYHLTPHRHGAPTVTWSSVNLVQGRMAGSARSRTAELRFSNYLQQRGVHTGINTLTFELDRLGPVRVSRLRIFADSGIQRTDIAPAKLELNPVLPGRKVSAGDQFRVGFRLDNDGGRPAHDVIVAVDYPRRALALRGTAERRFREIRRRRTGSFRFRALQPGHYRLALMVGSSANRPLAVIDVPISGAQRSTSGWRPIAIVAAALAVTFGAMMLLGDRRGRIRRRK